MVEKRKYYIVYKITNKVNNKIYIGIHVTENINDKYFGSGTNIKKAIKEFGKENFEKIILSNYDNEEDMLNEERRIVNDEFIKRGDTYNIILGGGGFKSINLVTVKDENGNTFDVHKTDPRYLNGELVSIMTNMAIVRYKTDKTNEYFMINKKDYDSKIHSTSSTDKVMVVDNNGRYFKVSNNNPQYLNGELISIYKDTTIVKDINDNIFRVSINDPRYLNGELVHIWKGKKHSLETITKMCIDRKGNGKGSTNSQYGKCWIHNLKIKKSKSIISTELEQWLDKGWIKGRKMKF